MSKAKQRQHGRPRISREDSAVFTLRVPESWKDKLRQCGSAAVRNAVRKLLVAKGRLAA